MVAPSTYFCFVVFFFCSSNFALNSAVQTTSPFKKIYAFGDSFTDTGNTRSASGPSGFGHVSSRPYGSTFFHHPTNRYSDGRLVIDFVTETLSLPYLPPYRGHKGNAPHGINFAVAGSTAINHAFFVKNNLTLDMTPQSIQTQMIWLNKFLESQGCKGAVSSSPECKAVFDDALIWVGEIGVNDYAYTVGSSVSSDTIRKLAISSVTGFLQTLLKKGVKHVVVQGLPPTGCLPLAMVLASEDDRDDLGCVKSANNQSYTHNVVYQKTVQDLRKQFPDAVIAYLDYWNAYATVMKNPKKYGFKEPFMACCGSGGPPYNFEVFSTCGTSHASACSNPSQYINWDGVHLTEAMYKALSHMFLSGTFSHPPFGSLMDRKQHV
ncbi:hypothetical protein POPTR_015G089700v4 [Populus trichocarpa]|uniref:GDSL-motif lipase/hydrolase family protein n=1 Tax=Populus trichocarpa TaxID=3694 RepID=B9IF45_POPTR|nr:GDSL esterase/lipase At3g48460 [Populus trichocarpa]PNT01209.1 hypothetical protein POPTR_015G089700v4 [Populus trichocarpa]|eukprot:XP_002321669.1 GDSL esterase/lipase At3g48460 [Populus trichocarpa]